MKFVSSLYLFTRKFAVRIAYLLGQMLIKLVYILSIYLMSRAHYVCNFHYNRLAIYVIKAAAHHHLQHHHSETVDWTCRNCRSNCHSICHSICHCVPRRAPVWSGLCCQSRILVRLRPWFEWSAVNLGISCRRLSRFDSVAPEASARQVAYKKQKTDLSLSVIVLPTRECVRPKVSHCKICVWFLFFFCLKCHLSPRL